MAKRAHTAATSATRAGGAAGKTKKAASTATKKTPGTLDTTEADKSVPKSIIVYRGEVGTHVRALMHEWRNVFLPWSSKKLHGKNKSLKDYLAIASTFSVTHLQLFTAPAHGTLLRILRLYNGPTLTLRVRSFALRSDVVASQRRPVTLDKAVWQRAPIVVLNNFANPTCAGRAEVALLEATFRAMFPSINIHVMQSTDIQRVCLFHYDEVSHCVEARHYYVDAKATGVARTVKKLLERRRPTRLGTLESVDDVLDREAAWSDTDGEGEEVPLAQPFRQHREQCRIKLHEIGPRMTLQLVKVENGFAGGEVIYHSEVVKTAREVQLNAAKVRARKAEKLRRRAEQDRNVDRKRSAAEERAARKRARHEAAAAQQQQHPFEVAGSPGDGDDDEVGAGTSAYDNDGYAGDLD